MRLIIHFLLIVLATYAGVAYVIAEPNPLLWTEASRFTQLFIALIGAIAIIIWEEGKDRSK